MRPQRYRRRVEESSVAGQIDLFPITQGMTAEWRAFVAVVGGPRRIEWVRSQRRRGIVREVISLASDDCDPVAMCTESPDHAVTESLLAESGDPFDRWCRERRSVLLGDHLDTETLFGSSPRPGPGRGRRR